MTAVKTIFKSSTSEKRWIELQKQKAELQSKKITPNVQEKIDIISSLMTSCKIGFSLTEAKVKKITKFLQEKTGKKKIRYGILSTEKTHQSILFKDIVILYIELDEKIIFKEYDSK